MWTYTICLSTFRAATESGLMARAVPGRKYAFQNVNVPTRQDLLSDMRALQKAYFLSGDYFISSFLNVRSASDRFNKFRLLELYVHAALLFGQSIVFLTYLLNQTVKHWTIVFRKTMLVKVTFCHCINEMERLGSKKWRRLQIIQRWKPDCVNTGKDNFLITYFWVTVWGSILDPPIWAKPCCKRSVSQSRENFKSIGWRVPFQEIWSQVRTMRRSQFLKMAKPCVISKKKIMIGYLKLGIFPAHLARKVLIHTFLETIYNCLLGSEK